MNPFSIGVVLALAVAPAWSQEVLDQIDDVNRSQDAENTATTVQKSDEAAAIREPSVPDVEQSVSESNAERQREKAEVEVQEFPHVHDSGTDAWTWDLDRMLQAGAILVLLVVILQTKWALGKATRANEIAQETANKSLRPWLLINTEEPSGDLYWHPSRGVSVDIDFPIKNVGKAPAMTVTILTKLIGVPCKTDVSQRFAEWVIAAPDNEEENQVCDIYPTATVVWPVRFNEAPEDFEHHIEVGTEFDLHIFVCLLYSSPMIQGFGLTAHMAQLARKDIHADIDSLAFGHQHDYQKDEIQTMRSGGSYAR